MRTTRNSLSISLLVPAALLLAAQLAAQTLEHRPPPAPAPAVPANKTEAASIPEKPVLPQGTNLQVEIPRQYPMKAKEAIEARLLHPLYVDGKLQVPQNTLLHGTVVALEPDSKTRLHGRLRGDFTPFHIARVQFDELLLPGGALAISTTGAVTGVPVLRLAAPGATPHQSLAARYWTLAKNRLRDQVAVLTAPGLGERARQALYHQLPYHPERIQAHTMWSFELAAPLTLPDAAPESQPAAPAAPTPGKPEIWSVNALLTANLTSATAKAGDPVQALVVEPVYSRDQELVVPQGSILIGRVSSAKAARSLGRNGKLRFTFQQVHFPEGTGTPVPNRAVQGSLAGASAESQQDLSMDAEGTITPHNQSSVIAPLLLTLLAGRALDHDRDDNLTVQTGVASNGFGLVGRVVGLAAGNRNLAAGIGYYAAALSIYENFLRRGRDVDFPKDTRIEIETTPLRAPVLKPADR
jgi:hypothetical protein